MVVGTTCPSIGGLSFLKGERVALPAKGKVTVIECWASWCGPCRAMAPHLSQIARKYRNKGLEVVGVTSEPMQAAQRYVASNGASMDYTVAVDADQDVQEKLLLPAGARGIPHAFIVDMHGTIRYSGHPGSPDFENTIGNLCAEWERNQVPPLELTPEALSAASVKELRKEMARRNLSYKGFVEKQEFIDALLKQA
eukprot:m.356331 g.356331  ORF g.356331 m.356331 type:complete len:196 (+) comp17512_c0_seq1:212-799(+)